MTVSDRPVEVRRIEKAELVGAEQVIQEVFALTDRQAIPAWEMYVVARNGGLAIGAFSGQELVGFIYGFPGFEGRRAFLHSNGLAVRRDYESRGIGWQLRVAQRDNALELGYDLIRWTTGALSSRQLYLYLTKLPGRLVAYLPCHLITFLPSAPRDEVVIEWGLTGPSAGARRGGPRPPDEGRELGPLLTTTEPIEDRVRRLTSWRAEDLARHRYAVEIPWDVGQLAARFPELAADWYAGARAVMEALIGGGYRGVGVVLDRAKQRSFVEFALSGGD
jgi:predicted GNAT superfamily acetyltransferase